MAPMIFRSFLLFSFLCFYSGLNDVVKGLECQSNPNNPSKVWYTLNVRPPMRNESNTNFTIQRENGQLIYTSIQAAIDSIPDGNDKWIQILLRIGSYWEKINLNKSCILLNGKYARMTFIEFNAHQSTPESATFTSVAENFVAKHITFVNTHNYNLFGRGLRNQDENANNITQAVAAMIAGDKSAFYSCAFLGIQDTLWDRQGRHYFKNCYIAGAVDFIMGSGQSIYDECIIRVVGNAISASGSGGVGYITAQSRSSEEDPSGFVFKGGLVKGNGKAWLGRAWGSHSRVIFNGTYFKDIIVPEGWSPWDFENDPIKHFTYTDQNSYGPGNDTSRRQFNTTLTDQQMQPFTDLSYIDAEGWISKQP